MKNRKIYQLLSLILIVLIILFYWFLNNIKIHKEIKQSKIEIGTLDNMVLQDDNINQSHNRFLKNSKYYQILWEKYRSKKLKE